MNWKLQTELEMRKIFFVISSRIYTLVFPVCHDDDDDGILFTGMVDQYKCFKSYFQSKPLSGILIITSKTWTSSKSDFQVLLQLRLRKNWNWEVVIKPVLRCGERISKGLSFISLNRCLKNISKWFTSFT